MKRADFSQTQMGANVSLAYTFLWLRDNEALVPNLGIPEILSRARLDRAPPDGRVLYVLAVLALSKELNGCAVDLAFESYKYGVFEAMVLGQSADSAIRIGRRPATCDSSELNALINAAKANR